MTDYKIEIKSTNPKIIINAGLSNLLIPGSIPDTARELIFGDGFCGQIEPGVIPMGTLTVEFENSFNQELKPGVFPNSVECIKFGKNFNKSLENVLPENLKILYIGCYSYNHPLNDVLPSTIMDFQLAVSQATKLIPINVTELHIYNYNYGVYNFDIPHNVKKIYFSPGSISCGKYIVNLLKNSNPQTECILSWCVGKMPSTIIDTYDLNEMTSDEVTNKFIFKKNNQYGKLNFFHIVKKSQSKEKIDEIKNVQLKTENQQMLHQDNDMCEKIKEIETENTQLKTENQQILRQNNDMIEKIKGIETENAQLKTENQQMLRQNNDMKEKMKNLTELFAEII